MKKFTRIFENKLTMDILDSYLHGIQDLGIECTMEYVKRDSDIGLVIHFIETIEKDSINTITEFYQELAELKDRLTEHNLELVFLNVWDTNNKCLMRSQVSFDEPGSNPNMIARINMTISFKYIKK